jgi:hypothetical protein
MSITSYSVSVVKKIVWLALIMSVVACAIIFASRSLSDNRQSATDGETKYLATDQRHTLMESEVITVTRRGFEPALITRPVGRFILMLDNRSGKDLNFRLARDTGQPLTEIASSRQELDWNDVLDVQPGTYVLTERNHPEWSCSIRITAQ